MTLNRVPLPMFLFLIQGLVGHVFPPEMQSPVSVSSHETTLKMRKKIPEEQLQALRGDICSLHFLKA
jgi:hypothetical protein